MLKTTTITLVFLLAACASHSGENYADAGTDSNQIDNFVETDAKTGNDGSAGFAGMGHAGFAGMAGVAGSNTGGSGGSCIPKTCETYSYDNTGNTDLACDVIQDGCGNVINCGDCSDPMHTCGGKPNPRLNDPGTPNICAGKCTGEAHPSCPGVNNYKLTCTADFDKNNAPPQPYHDCVWQKETILDGFWCCFH